MVIARIRRAHAHLFDDSGAARPAKFRDRGFHYIVQDGLRIKGVHKA